MKTIVNYPQPKKEVVLEVHAKDNDYYLYPSYIGGQPLDALVKAESSIAGQGTAFREVHTDTNGRYGKTIYLNMYKVETAHKTVLTVPEEITKLYETPEDEEKEDREKRIGKVKQYFETD